MLWILLGICALTVGIGVCNDADALTVTGTIFLFSCILVTVVTLYCYNDTKSTVKAKIAVLEQRNEEVLSQVEPVVNKYLEYESSTLAEFKPDASKVIALSMYPELKGNEMLQEQLKIIKENQRDITELKLEDAGLKAYKIWLFME